jgi:predicted DNA-binding transcriptional regulator AlpA
MAPQKTIRPLPQPRLIRFRDAPHYLGMDRNRFNAEVRPLVTEVRIGTQGIAFDRLELDAWVDDYLGRNGRPGRSKGAMSWDENETPASRGGQDGGSSTSGSAGSVFAKALERLSLKKRNDTSQE